MGEKRIISFLFIGLLYLLSGCSSDSTYDVNTLEWISEEGYEWAELPLYRRGADGFEEVPFSHSRVFL